MVLQCLHVHLSKGLVVVASGVLIRLHVVRTRGSSKRADSMCDDEIQVFNALVMPSTSIAGRRKASLHQHGS